MKPDTARYPASFAAAVYAARGWASYPLAPNAKIPLRGSHGLLDATTDRDVLTRLFAQPGLNVGIRTGSVSKLVVVDIDCHLGGPNGFEALAEPARLNLQLPTGSPEYGSAKVATPSGGLHFYYALPDGVKLKNSAGVLAPGIDVRAEGGYVVAPPSRTPAGSYLWKRYPARLMAAPQWLIESCKIEIRPQRYQHRPMRPNDEMPPTVAEMIKDRLERIENAPRGQRNHTLNREAFYLAHFVGRGFGADDLDAMLLGAAAKLDMPHREIRRTIDGALGDGLRRSFP